MSLFICPVCKQSLKRTDSSFVCSKRHCFDLSKEGYVNLAVGKSDSGDDSEMCRARHEFLSAGYYEPLSSAIADELIDINAITVCDAGCGEGYYSRTIKSKIPSAEIYALDLAKASVRIGAKKEKGKNAPISYAVAGIFDMPLKESSFDAVISVFAPIPDDECYRILKDNGALIVVHPGRRHLMGLKSALYDEPYENEEKDFNVKGLTHLYDKRVSYSKVINAEHIESLFLMTPYRYKTSISDYDKLKALSSLDTELDFIVSVYKKL